MIAWFNVVLLIGLAAAEQYYNTNRQPLGQCQDLNPQNGVDIDGVSY